MIEKEGEKERFFFFRYEKEDAEEEKRRRKKKVERSRRKRKRVFREVVCSKVAGPCMGKEKKKVKKYYFNKNRYIIDNLM